MSHYNTVMNGLMEKEVVFTSKLNVIVRPKHTLVSQGRWTHFDSAPTFELRQPCLYSFRVSQITMLTCTPSTT